MRILHYLFFLLVPTACLSQKLAEKTFTSLSEALQYKDSVKLLTITYPLSKDSMRLIENFHSLQHLELSNQLNRILIDFSGLKRLHKLILTNNYTALPESVPELSQLESIILHFNNLTELPHWVCNQQNLKTIGIVGNKINKLPDCFFSLKNIETIYTGFNKISIFDERLLSFPKLITLDIAGNNITTLPENPNLPTSLNIINLSDNKTSWDKINAFQKALPNTVWLIHNEYKVPFYNDSIAECVDKDTTFKTIFPKCEICPQFQGGDLKFKNFLNRHLDTSIISSNKNFTDSVMIKFVVFREGGISRITVMESFNKQLSIESVRLIRESCAYWIPANFSGRLVNSWITLKFYFINQIIAGINHKSITTKFISP